MEYAKVPIIDFPAYFIDTEGYVWNRFNKQIFGGITKGYRRVRLTRQKYESVSVFVHRLVAEAFLPNLEAKPTVDHIDRNRLNNHVTNLRWASCVEQMQNKTTQCKRTDVGTTEVGIRYYNRCWQANLTYNKVRYDEYFSSFEEAKQWRDNLKQQLLQSVFV